MLAIESMKNVLLDNQKRNPVSTEFLFL